MAIKPISVKILPYLAIAYTIGLLAIMLIKVDNLPKPPVVFADKIVHSTAFFVLSLIWFLSIFTTANKTKYLKLLALVSLGAIVYGIFIEVLQYGLTTYRSFDFFDMLANTIGVSIAAIISIAAQKKMIHFKNNLVLDKK